MTACNGSSSSEGKLLLLVECFGGIISRVGVDEKKSRLSGLSLRLDSRMRRAHYHSYLSAGIPSRQSSCSTHYVFLQHSAKSVVSFSKQ